MSESESIDTVNQPLARATLDAIRARWQRDEADLDSKTEHLLKAAEDLTCDKDDYCILPKGHEGPCVIAGVDIPQEATSEEAVVVVGISTAANGGARCAGGGFSTARHC